MPNGTVKFFNAAKGFGFISPEGGGKDVFVPSATIVSAGIAILKTGQRVSFEEQPDGKGPKAVNLKLLADAAVPFAAPARPANDDQLTLYQDPSSEDGRKILAELRAAGHEPRVVDYITASPNAEQLKKLSLLLRDSNESLVRKYDHLFQALHLDDRFISENEFWGAVVEHPSLINGPVVATAAKAAICRSKDDVKAFLATAASNGTRPAAKRKVISQRLLNLMMGRDVPPPVEKTVEIAESKPVLKESKKAKAVAPKKPEARKPVKAAPKAAKTAKVAPKAKAAAKKAVRAPAKKSRSAQKPGGR